MANNDRVDFSGFQKTHHIGTVFTALADSCRKLFLGTLPGRPDLCDPVPVPGPWRLCLSGHVSGDRLCRNAEQGCP